MAIFNPARHDQYSFVPTHVLFNYSNKAGKKDKVESMLISAHLSQKGENTSKLK